MKNIKKSIFSLFLTLAMVLTLIPMNSLTVFADEYSNIRVEYGGSAWYDDSGYVTYKKGDILTNCFYSDHHDNRNLYCDGVTVEDGSYVSGTIVKIDGNSNRYLYLCSSSNHETKKNATTGLCPTCYPSKNYEGYYISKSSSSYWDYEKGTSMGHLNVGDTLTDCMIQQYGPGCAAYCDGESIAERTTISGTVTVVKIDGNSNRYLYLCSASDHKTNADETTGLCPTCDPNAPKHAHSFTYSVDGATLKATCGNTTDCGLTTADKSISLTLTAGAQDYSNPFALSIDGKAAWANTKLKDPVIVYSDSAAGEYSETLPTTAGTHYAKIKVEDDKTEGYHYSGALPFTTAAHNITFIAPSGASIGKKVNVVAGESVDISPLASITVDESLVKNFTGWTCGPSGFAIDKDATSFIMPNTDITVEAGYQDCWLVTINNNETISYDYHTSGVSVSVTAATAPTGKEFTGWEADGVTLGDSSAATATFTMPSSKVTLTAKYGSLYTITTTDVTAKIGDSVVTSALSGKSIVLTATDKTSSDKKFKNWTITGITGLTTEQLATNPLTVTMPESNISVTANYYDKHTVTVTNGTTSVTGGKAFVGDTVSVTAGAPATGKKFKNWTGEGVTFANANDIYTTFTMLDSDVTVTANYEDTEWQTLVNQFAEGGTITLEKDYKAALNDIALTVPVGKTVTLDMNGHTLNRNLYKYNNTSTAYVKTNGSVIVVNGTLIIKNGTVKGGSTKEFGGGINLNTGATAYVYDVNITDNLAMRDGSGIYKNANATLVAGGATTVMGNWWDDLFENNSDVLDCLRIYSNPNITADYIDLTVANWTNPIMIAIRGTAPNYSAPKLLRMLRSTDIEYDPDASIKASKHLKIVDPGTKPKLNLDTNDIITNLSNPTSSVAKLPELTQGSGTINAINAEGHVHEYNLKSTVYPKGDSTSEFYYICKCGTPSETLTWTHQHTWTYSLKPGASNVLVATCTCDSEVPGYSECVYKNETGENREITLTLTASSANYSGNSVEATLTDTGNAWATNVNSTLPTIKYAGRGTTEYTESNVAPTKVGKYTAKITVNDQTASVDFEIKQPEIDVTKSDVNSTGIIKESYTVGKAIQDIAVDINFDISKINSTNNYQNSVVVKEGTKVLEYGENKDYTVSEGSIKVTLTKSYLNSLSVGTHNITIEITDNNSQKLTYPITVTVASVPSSGHGSSSSSSYKVPNTSVGYENNPMTKTIGLLAIAAAAGYVVKKKED